MSCYICAHLLPNTPKTATPLPGGSLVAVDDPIGTCVTCGILACSLHAARYAPYQCAICVPAAAIVSGITGTPSAAGEAAVSAIPLDRQPPGDAARALQRIISDMAPDRDIVRPRISTGPNVVDDLDGAMAEITGGVQRHDLTGPSSARQPTIVASAVRARMDGLIPNPTPLSAAMLTGAIAIAYALATNIRMFEEHRTITELPMPWTADAQVLLDPLIWMVYVAASLR